MVMHSIVEDSYLIPIAYILGYTMKIRVVSTQSLVVTADPLVLLMALFFMVLCLVKL